MKLLNNKRGDVQHEVYFFVLELLLVLIVMLALMGYVRGLEEGTTLEKSYLTKDLGLLATTAYAAPGDLTYTYTNEKIDLKKYEFEFRDERVRMRAGIEDTYTYYYFADNTAKGLSGIIAESDNVVLTGSPGNIEATKVS